MGTEGVKSIFNKVKLKKLEHLGKGIHYIRILQKLYPEILKKSKKKIFSKPTLEYEYIQNLTLVQKVFFEIKEKKDVEIQKVN